MYDICFGSPDFIVRLVMTLIVIALCAVIIK